MTSIGRLSAYLAMATTYVGLVALMVACGESDGRERATVFVRGAEAGRKSMPTVAAPVIPTISTPTIPDRPATSRWPTGTPRPLTGSIAAPRGLNVRAGPGTEHPVLGKLADAASVVVVGQQGDCAWLQVQFDGNIMGWVSGEFVQRSFDCGALNETLTRTASVPAADLAEDGEQVQVVAVVDGDTITVMRDGNEIKVRYIGVDTPEQGGPGAAEATDANRKLVSGQQVTLVTDVSDTDRSGRLLRYVFLPSGLFVNLELVKQGWAEAVAYPPDTAHQTELEQAEKQAVAQGVGRWARSATANKNANLRAGPDVSHPLAGGVTAGDSLVIVGRTPVGDWYQLATGAWIAAFLVNNAPANVPVARTVPTPPPVPTATPAPVVVPQRSQPATPPPQRQMQAVCNCSGPDLDCKHFGSHASAQACYNYCVQTVGFDYHGLDGNDNDGLACESLP